MIKIPHHEKKPLMYRMLYLIYYKIMENSPIITFAFLKIELFLLGLVCMLVINIQDGCNYVQYMHVSI